MKNCKKNSRIVSTGLILFLLLFPQMARAEELDGKWNVVLDTEGGIREAVWDLSVDGEKVTLTLGKSKIPGWQREGKFELAGELYSEEAGYSAQFKVSGVVEANHLRGVAVWDIYEMKFAATRVE